jgi:hypothetical protein
MRSHLHNRRVNGHLTTRFFAAVAAVMFIACGLLMAERANAAGTALSDPELWTAVTGGRNDGFDVYAKYSGDDEKTCKVDVRVTMDDGSTKSYSYSKVVRKTDKMWVGGEAGLSPAPVKSVEITSSSCS